MKITININNIIIKSKIQKKILKLQIKIKSNWNSHIKIVKTKMMTQCITLLKIIVFTWKTFFSKTKPMYSAVEKPAMTYASTIWHKSTNKLKGGLGEKLLITQNKCLKTMIDVFKIVSIQILKVKTHMFLFMI